MSNRPSVVSSFFTIPGVSFAREAVDVTVQLVCRIAARIFSALSGSSSSPQPQAAAQYQILQSGQPAAQTNNDTNNGSAQTAQQLSLQSNQPTQEDDQEERARLLAQKLGLNAASAGTALIWYDLTLNRLRVHGDTITLTENTKEDIAELLALNAAEPYTQIGQVPPGVERLGTYYYYTSPTHQWAIIDEDQFPQRRMIPTLHLHTGEQLVRFQAIGDFDPGRWELFRQELIDRGCTLSIISNREILVRGFY